MSLLPPIFYSFFFFLLAIWVLVWKGIALWHAARRSQKWWFGILLVVQTFGILEIIYIFVVARRHPETLGNGDGNNALPQSPVAAINEARQQQKDAAKDRIRVYVEEHGRITNDDTQELLNVSDATATNYLQELEDEGMLEQQGENRGAYYVPKNG